ncbi:cytochrome c oxidase assembly protein Cox11 [Bradyrhizobium sp. LM2.3]
MDQKPTISRDQSRTATKGRRPFRGVGRDVLVASICGGVVALMVGASYAAVPFYNWFCRATGFNGTTQVATSAPASGPIARKIAVRFDSNVAPGLPWKFEPEQSEIEVNIGQVVTVFYTVTNQAARTTAGQAAYNVAPLTVGSYFARRSTASASPSRPWRPARSARCRSCSTSTRRSRTTTTTTG